METWFETIDRNLYNFAQKHYKYSLIIDKIRWTWEKLFGI